jgi:hypothetical protein
MWTRPFRWWHLGEDTLRLLSAPRTDIARSDRDVEQVFRDSRLFTAGRTLRMKAGRAWADSRVLALMTPLAADLFPPEPAARVRVVGLLVFVASASAWALLALKPTPPGPMTWIVPALGAASGVLIACAAAPVARALEDKAH